MTCLGVLAFLSEEYKVWDPSSCWYLLVSWLTAFERHFCLSSLYLTCIQNNALRSADVLTLCWNLIFPESCLVILFLFYSSYSCFTWTRCLCSSVCLPLVQFKEKTTQPWYLYRKCVLFSNKDKVQKKRKKSNPFVFPFFMSPPFLVLCGRYKSH